MTAFAQSSNGLRANLTQFTTLRGESEWKQSGLVQGRLALLKQCLLWLEDQRRESHSI